MLAGFDSAVRERRAHGKGQWGSGSRAPAITARMQVSERARARARARTALNAQVFKGQTPYTTAVDIYSAAMTTWCARDH